MQPKVIFVLLITLCCSSPGVLAFGGDGDGDGRGSGDGGSTGVAIRSAVERLAKASPVGEQAAVEKLFKELTQKPPEDLYLLRAAPDACQLLDCKGLQCETVKPIVEMALDLRKAQEARRDSDRSFHLAIGAFAVSVVSLSLSIVGNWRVTSAKAVRSRRLSGRRDRPEASNWWKSGPFPGVPARPSAVCILQSGISVVRNVTR